MIVKRGGEAREVSATPKKIAEKLSVSTQKKQMKRRPKSANKTGGAKGAARNHRLNEIYGTPGKQSGLNKSVTFNN